MDTTSSPYLTIQYTRTSVCAQDDYVNHAIAIAEVYDDTERIHYYGADNPLRTLKITEVQGKRLS